MKKLLLKIVLTVAVAFGAIGFAAMNNVQQADPGTGGRLEPTIINDGK